MSGSAHRWPRRITMSTQAPDRLDLRVKLMLVPSSAVESMGMGGLMGAAALQQQTLTGGAKPAE